MTTMGFDPDPTGFINEQMVDHIEARIRSGDFSPGAPLPAERQLAEQYGVSVGTARRAIRPPRRLRLVRTLHSKQTFVQPPDRRTATARDEARIKASAESRSAGAGREGRRGAGQLGGWHVEDQWRLPPAIAHVRLG